MNPKSPYKVLFIQLRQLGDILLTTPCLREMKTAFPDCHLSFLTHPMGKHILRGNPYLDEHLLYEEGDLFEEVRFLKKLRDENYDLVLDFMNNPRSGLFSLATKANQRISFRSARKFFYTKTVRCQRGSQYIVQEKFELLRTIALQPENEKLDLPQSDEDRAFVERLGQVSQQFLTGPLRIALSPTHRRENRRWATEDFVHLAKKIAREWGALVIWLWGPGEEDYIEPLCQATKGIAIKAPPTTFREMAALIDSCDLFVGNSNGPSHVAVAMDTPSLQLHGHTDGMSWCPHTDRHRFVQCPEFGRVKDPSMASLTFDSVWGVLEKMHGLVQSEASRRTVNQS